MGSILGTNCEAGLRGVADHLDKKGKMFSCGSVVDDKIWTGHKLCVMGSGECCVRFTTKPKAGMTGAADHHLEEKEKWL